MTHMTTLTRLFKEVGIEPTAENVRLFTIFVKGDFNLRSGTMVTKLIEFRDALPKVKFNLKFDDWLAS